jgi:hypothetical protein
MNSAPHMFSHWRGTGLGALISSFALFGATGCSDSSDSSGVVSTLIAPEVDWVRTEERDSCANHAPFRQAFFGELHIHTAYSGDAAVAGTLALPADAYRFAKGEAIPIPPIDAQGNSDRIAQLGRALDFAAVTDHAESFGDFPADASGTLRACYQNGAIVESSLCNPQQIWMDTGKAAEDYYDRTPDCEFTTFHAYEWSGRGRRPERRSGSMHRNVIFRNAQVPERALTADTAESPEALWSQLSEQCLNTDTNCDVLTIPHNSNLSRGYMFDPLNLDGEPFSTDSAELRAAFEPLVEIMQSKGDSECRFGLGNVDELCSFEKLQRTGSTFQPPDPNQVFEPLSFVRNGLKEGLRIEESTDVNPFAFGFVAATDGHTAAAGSVREHDYPVAGNFGVVDASPGLLLAQVPPGGIAVNGGGLAGLWAEENSRDALFAAMRRRETFATSGPRITIRFFAGNYDDTLCDDPEMVSKAYNSGVPMGGTLRRATLDEKAPRFALMAMSDPGTAEYPGIALQRIQIIKGWLDAQGELHEKVVDAAGDADNGAYVDPEVCIPRGEGFTSLCEVWSDPEFDPAHRAFYYARALENPTCRWHSYVCNDQGVRCDDPTTITPQTANCCDQQYPRTIQERAWTSPVFYTP